MDIINFRDFFLAWVLFIVYMNSLSGSTYSSGSTYEEKVMTIEEMEKSQPTKFLDASGTYNQNFWGTKFKVHGIIENKATVASYKDAVVKVTYYSATKTEIANNTYTIYKNFPPTSSTEFELKIENYRDVETIG
jgi:hypothetical protein